MEQISTKVLMRSEAIGNSKELHLLKRCRDLCKTSSKSCSSFLSLLIFFAKLLLETWEGGDGGSGFYSVFSHLLLWGSSLVSNRSSCLRCCLLLFKATTWIVRILSSLFTAPNPRITGAVFLNLWAHNSSSLISTGLMFGE